MKLTLEQEMVLRAIPLKKPTLKENIITRKDISKITGINTREVSYIIESLRDEFPICSDRGNGGYWMGNENECKKFIHECLNHAKGLKNTASKMMKYISQEIVFDDD